MGTFIKDTEQIGLAITPVDAAGNPAVITGKPAWGSSDTTVLAVNASDDGLSAVASAVGKLGKATINVSLGSVVGSLDIEVHGGDPVGFTINAGPPTAKAATSGASSSSAPSSTPAS